MIKKRFQNKKSKQFCLDRQYFFIDDVIRMNGYFYKVILSLFFFLKFSQTAIQFQTIATWE